MPSFKFVFQWVMTGDPFSYTNPNLEEEEIQEVKAPFAECPPCARCTECFHYMCPQFAPRIEEAGKPVTPI